MSLGGHPSAFDLDALALNALTSPETDATEAHLAACERCRACLAVRREADSLFAMHVGPRTMSVVEERLRRRRLFPAFQLGSAGLAAAAVVALALIAVHVGHPSPAIELGIKGGPTLQLFCLHAGEVAAVANGDRLAAGDHVRLVVEPMGFSQLLVVSVDGAGHPNVYFPFGGTHSGALDGSGRVSLPNSLTLDTSPGPERIYALFSSRELSVTAVMPALQALAARGPAALRTQRALDVPVDKQASAWFEKSP